MSVLKFKLEEWKHRDGLDGSSSPKHDLRNV